jgi:glyoxylase-like metal-dependent hydrolase (beta-lactamase superfamily II)
MHPNHEHATKAAGDPDAVLAQRLEIGRQSGVPESALERYAERFQRGGPPTIARVVEPDRPLLDGVKLETDLGEWVVYETPGHAPSHVCFFQPERRLLISGDHVLGRVSLYYDYGWTPDPVGEYLRSLDVVGRLDARLGLSGHGRPFVDVHGHVVASRELVNERIRSVRAALSDEPRTALQIAPQIHDEPLSERNASWQLAETLCYLTHLEHEGEVARVQDAAWRRAQP